MIDISVAPGLACLSLAKESWLDFWQKHQAPYLTLVARLDAEVAEVAGCLRLFDLGRWTGIGGVYVLEQHRRKGIALAMLEAVEHPRQALHVGGWSSDRPELRELYKKAGFTESLGSLMVKAAGDERRPGGMW